MDLRQRSATTGSPIPADINVAPNLKPHTPRPRRSPSLNAKTLPGVPLPSSSLSPWWRQPGAIGKLVATSMCSFGFGLLLEKGRVFEPRIIQDQFLFRDFRMLTMFLSAAASSQFMLSLLSLMPVGSSGRRAFETVEEEYVKRYAVNGVMGVAVGASILGMGMAVAGTCPGTINAQLGAGVRSSYPVLAGAMVGTLIFANMQHALAPLCRARQPKQVTLPRMIDRPFALTVLPFIALELAVIAAIMVYFPSSASVSLADFLAAGPLGIWKLRAWPAYCSGFGIGMLQVPSALLASTLIGSSSNFMGVLSILNRVPLLKKLIPRGSDLGKVQFPGAKSVTYIAGLSAAIAGGFMSAVMSGSYGAAAEGLKLGMTFGTSEAAIALQAFFGGILLLVGSRIAGGCTSGHGISGFGLSMVTSIVAVPAMFASAIVTANAMRWALGHA